MAGVKESTNGKDRGYYLSASLVNKLIAVIFGGIITIAGYMVVWALDDRSYKAEQRIKMETIVGIEEKFDDHILTHPDRDLDRRLIIQGADIKRILEKLEDIERAQQKQYNGK